MPGRAPDGPVILSGSGERDLGAAIARALGLEEVPRLLERFPDGELHVQAQAPLAGRDVYLLVSLAAPTGERLLELMLLSDAARRDGAAAVTAVVPYVGYARQDRRKRPGEPVGARVVADLLRAGRFDRLVAVDLHDPSLEGVLAPCVEHLTAAPLLVDALRPHAGEDAVVVAPDLGAAKLAEEYARRLGAPMAVVHKERRTGSDVSVRRVIGEVRGARPILVDDMISTAGTVRAAADALLQRGCAPAIVVAATHGLFAGPAVERLSGLPLRAVLTTDSVPVEAPRALPHRQVGLAPLLAEAVRRLHGGEPLGDLLASR